MSKFFDSLKHAIVEEDADPKPQAAPATVAHGSTAAQAPLTAPAASTVPFKTVVVDQDALNAGDGDATYKKILAKTDFASTPVAATIKKYLIPSRPSRRWTTTRGSGRRWFRPRPRRV